MKASTWFILKLADDKKKNKKTHTHTHTHNPQNQPFFLNWYLKFFRHIDANMAVRLGSLFLIQFSTHSADIIFCLFLFL